MNKLFLCDIEIDQLERELHRCDFELETALVNLGIEIDPFRAAVQILQAGYSPHEEWSDYCLYMYDLGFAPFTIRGCWFTLERIKRMVGSY